MEVDNLKHTITCNDSLFLSKSAAEQYFQTISNFLEKAFQQEQSQNQGLPNGLGHRNSYSNYHLLVLEIK